MKKSLLSLLVFLAATPSFAVVTSFRVNNHTNYAIECAFAQIAVANPQAPEVTVYHWTPINNGASHTFNGRTDGFFCEAQSNHDLRWGGQAGFLCVSRSQYVNPFYKANQANECNSFGGEMVGFRDVMGNGFQQITLNAP